MTRVLGVDPGSLKTGFGIIEQNENGDLKCLCAGTIQPGAKLDYNSRIFEVGRDLSEIIRKYSPQVMVVEKAFFAKNADSAMKLGQVRGICIYEGKRNGLSIFEYTPTQVKMGIVGHGRAEKESVQRMVSTLLGTQIESLDTSDALALALFHQRLGATQDLIEEMADL